MDIYLYLGDVDASNTLDEVRDTLHNAEHLARELGRAHFTSATGHHGHLARLRERCRHFCGHLYPNDTILMRGLLEKPYFGNHLGSIENMYTLYIYHLLTDVVLGGFH